MTGPAIGAEQGDPVTPLYEKYLASQKAATPDTTGGAAPTPLYQKYLESTRKGTVTAGPITPIGVPASEYARLASTGTLKDRIQANLMLQSAPIELQRQVAPIARRMQAPGPVETAAKIALGNSISLLSPEAANAATEHDLAQFGEGGGNAGQHANLFGAAATLGDLAGSAGMFEAATPGVAAVEAPVGIAAKAIRGAKTGAITGGALSAGGKAVFGGPNGRGPKEIAKAGVQGGAMGAAMGGGMALLHGIPEAINGSKVAGEGLQTAPVQNPAGQARIDTQAPIQGDPGDFTASVTSIVKDVHALGGDVAPEDIPNIIGIARAVHEAKLPPDQHIQLLKNIAGMIAEKRPASTELDTGAKEVPVVQDPSAPFRANLETAKANRVPVSGRAPAPATATAPVLLPPEARGGTPEETPNIPAAPGPPATEPGNGRPVLYHGTNSAFDTFDPARGGSVWDDSASRSGMFFTESPEEAQHFAARAVQKNGGEPRVVRATLNIKRPKIITDEVASEYEKEWLRRLEDSDPDEYDFQMATKQYQDGPGIGKGVELAIEDAARDPRYDGAIVDMEGGDKWHVAFKPEQVTPVIAAPAAPAVPANRDGELFGRDVLPAPAPSKTDQVGMFGANEGTKLAQDDARKLGRFQKAISPQEMSERRDELGAKAPAQPFADDTRDLLQEAPEPGAAPESPIQQVSRKIKAMFDELRTTGSGDRTKIRPLDRVSDDGLLAELHDLYTVKLPQYGERAQYTRFDDESGHITDKVGASVVKATRHGAGATDQAKARMNIKQAAGLADKITAELRRRHGDDFNEADALESWRDRQVERAGMAQSAALPEDQEDLPEWAREDPTEFRFSGPGLTPEQVTRLRRSVSGAVSDPYAHLTGADTELAEGLARRNYSSSMHREVNNQVQKALGDTPPEVANQYGALQRAAQHEAHADNREVQSGVESDMAVKTQADMLTEIARRQKDYRARANRASTAEDRALIMKEGRTNVADFRREQNKIIGEHQEAATRLAMEADQHREHAQEARSSVPDGVEDSPGFKNYVEQYRLRVEPHLDAMYLEAGGSPESMVKGEHGYFPLISERRLYNSNVAKGLRAYGRAEAEAPGSGPRAMTPTAGRIRAIFGQKGSVMAGSPLGAEAPLQGPMENEATNPGIFRGLNTTQRVSGVNRATGEAERYSNNIRQVIDQRAGEGARKSANNAIFRAVAKTGRLLEPGDFRDPGKHYISFTDSKEIVQPKQDVMGEVYNPTGFGQGGSSYEPGVVRETPVHTYEVSPEAYGAVMRTLARENRGPSHPTIRGLQKVSSAATNAVLANPIIAPLHFARESGNMETVGATGNLASDIAHMPYGANSLIGMARTLKLDTSSPEYIAAERTAARAGALRTDNTEGSGLINKGHDWLFDPATGWDRLVRVKATMNYMADLQKKGLPTEGPEFTRGLRRYVTSVAGEYTKGNRGEVMQAVSSMAPFAPIHGASLKTGLKAMAGSQGVPDATATQRLGTLLRSPLGKTIGTGAISAGLAGHAMLNGNLQLPFYHVPGEAAPRYFRGSKEDARKALPKGSTEFSLGDPGMSLAQSLARPLWESRSGDKGGEVARAAFNATAGFAGPLATLGMELGTGRSNYLDRSGDFESVVPVRLGKTSGLLDRAVSAARSTNALSTGLIPGTGYGRPQSSVLPLLKQEPLSDIGATLAHIHDFEASVYRQITQATPEERSRIIRDNIQQLRDYRSDEGRALTGKEIGLIRRNWMKAAQRAGLDRTRRYLTPPPQREP